MAPFKCAYQQFELILNNMKVEVMMAYKKIIEENKSQINYAGCAKWFPLVALYIIYWKNLKI